MIEFTLAVVYYFKEILSANLDLFYVLTVLIIINDFIKNKLLIKKTLRIFLPIFIYGIIQVILNPYINILRLFVNISKTFLNLYLFIYIKENSHKLDYKKVINYLTLFFSISIPYSLLFKTSRIWRFNDLVNSYTKTRLKLFYFEPSELAFQISIVLIFVFFYFLNEKGTKKKAKYIVYMILLFYILKLSSGLGGIVGLIVSFTIMYSIYYCKNHNIKKFLMNYLVIAVSVIIIYLLISNSTNFYLRIVSILKGKDSSMVYRYNVGFKVMKNALINTKLLGLGFGNLNTDIVKNAYYQYGLVDVIANSFMYFISEGGIFSILYLVFIIVSLIRGTIKSKSILKYGLLFFIMFYQVAGGYFTNPINWIIYGIICCKLNTGTNINSRKASLQYEKNFNNN